MDPLTKLARQTFRPVQIPNALEPTTNVRVVFRGGPPIVDKFDGQDIIIPVEANEARLAGDPDWQRRYYEAVELEGIEFQVATHLRGRAIVPGTRNPYESRKASYRLGISWTPTGTFVDPPRYCQPFSDAELAHFQLPEGLDRKAFEDSRSQATTMSTMSAISHVGNLDATLNAPLEMAPPADAEGLATIAAGEREAVGAGVGGSSRTRRGGVQNFRQGGYRADERG